MNSGAHKMHATQIRKHIMFGEAVNKTTNKKNQQKGDSWGQQKEHRTEI